MTCPTPCNTGPKNRIDGVDLVRLAEDWQMTQNASTSIECAARPPAAGWSDW
jgi:hypothetical protein